MAELRFATRAGSTPARPGCCWTRRASRVASGPAETSRCSEPTTRCGARCTCASPRGGPGSQGTRLVEKTVYGEVLATQDALDGLLLGRVYRVYDTAGCVTHDAFGFEGHLLQHDRRLLADVDADPDWSAAASDTDPVLKALAFDLRGENNDAWDALEGLMVAGA